MKRGNAMVFDPAPKPTLPESLRQKLNNVVDEIAQEQGLSRQEILAATIGFIQERGIPKPVRISSAVTDGAGKIQGIIVYDAEIAGEPDDWTVFPDVLVKLSDTLLTIAYDSSYAEIRLGEHGEGWETFATDEISGKKLCWRKKLDS